MNIDIVHWVSVLGYFGMFAVVFSEMGIFFAFFLPADSLALTAGIWVHKGLFHLPLLSATFFSAAFLGYLFGYWFGGKLGHWLMAREDTIWFRKEYIVKAREFYDKHGGKAIVLGRFVPIVRTFVPIVAGMSSMNYKRFVLFDFIGAAVWGIGCTLAGYFLGMFFPRITEIFLPVIIGVILLSLSPGIYHYFKERRAKKKAQQSQKNTD